MEKKNGKLVVISLLAIVFIVSAIAVGAKQWMKDKKAEESESTPAEQVAP